MKTLKLEGQGKTFEFYNTPTAPSLTWEIFGDNYHVLSFRSGLKFDDGDIVVDLGANEGMFSIMIAKLFPQVTVVALEPVPRTFCQLLANIKLNNVTNIIPYNMGVGAKDSSVDMTVCKIYSGGSSSLITFNPESHTKEHVRICTIDDLFYKEKIQHCKLLKIDIEGMEHEALYATECLDKVEYLVGEIHINERLKEEGYSIERLLEYVQSKTKVIHVDCIKMAE
jgi:FkbM family methyltransferase